MLNRPNILMIMVDQQRYDCIGYSNLYPVKTPNLDRLASEGIWFSNAYSHLPVCGPARQSLVNGRRPEAIGCLWNYGNGLKIPALDPSEYSWARELKQCDYTTGYIGKWGVNPNFDATFYGYDYYVGEDQYAIFKENEYPHIKLSNSYFGERNPIPLEDSKTHWMANQTNSMIQQLSDIGMPWHIRVNFAEPHLPCQPSEPYASMYQPADIPKWESFTENFKNKPYIQKQQLYNWDIEGLTWDDWAPTVARYYGVISQLDDAIGNIISYLEQAGMAENTMIIFTSDHGDMCGSHRMMDKHYILYDDVVRVPLIIKWPNKIKQGEVCDQFVYNLLDLPPTILHLLDLDIPDFFHGKSLVPFIQQGIPNDWREDVVCTYNGQQFGLYTQRMIRSRSWKYIWNTTDIDELYHLDDDPYELTNLIHDKQYEDILQDLRKRLYNQLHNDGDGLVNNQWMQSQLLNGKKL